MMTQRRRPPLRGVAVAAIVLLLVAVTALVVTAAGGYTVGWWTVDGGGQSSAGAGYTMTGTVAQPDAQPAAATGGGYQLNGGFWHNAADTGNDTAGLEVIKTVGLNPAGCSATPSIEAPVGSTVYFCVTIRNSGAVTFTHHQLSDAQLGVALDFAAVLPPGAAVQITKDQAPGLAYLVNTPITNTAVVTSTNFAAGATDAVAAAVVGRITRAATAQAIVTLDVPTVDPNVPDPAHRLFLPIIGKQE